MDQGVQLVAHEGKSKLNDPESDSMRNTRISGSEGIFAVWLECIKHEEHRCIGKYRELHKNG